MHNTYETASFDKLSQNTKLTFSYILIIDQFKSEPAMINHILGKFLWQVTTLCSTTSANNSWEHLRWKNVTLYFLPARAARPLKCDRVQSHVSSSHSQRASLSAECADWAFDSDVLCLFCSEQWVTSNTTEASIFYFSSGSKNMVEKVSEICVVVLAW